MSQLNQIGSFTFLELQGLPDTVKQQLELSMRPGVDGVAIWETGFRGMPFPLVSGVDVRDKAHALETFDLYKQLMEQDPVPIVWQDQDLSAGNLVFQVLNVRLLNIVPLAAATGGQEEVSGAWLQCQWDILPLIASEEEPEAP